MKNSGVMPSRSLSSCHPMATIGWLRSHAFQEPVVVPPHGNNWLAGSRSTDGFHQVFKSDGLAAIVRPASVKPKLPVGSGMAGGQMTGNSGRVRLGEGIEKYVRIILEKSGAPAPEVGNFARRQIRARLLSGENHQQFEFVGSPDHSA